ncbi:MAG: segregation and condensation protein A [Spirochaetota bacterium]
MSDDSAAVEGVGEDAIGVDGGHEEPSGANGEEGVQFRLDAFEGPLDLLLFLIQKSEISIHDIPVSQITEQYLAYLRYSTGIDLDNITEFYLMAATLLHIKSRMLLPVEAPDDDEFEDPRRELVNQLIEYQKYKKLTQLMLQQQEVAGWSLERRRDQPTLPFPEEEEQWDNLDVWELLKTFSRIVSSISDDRVLDLFEQVTVNEKLSLIEEYLEEREEFRFTDLITTPDSVMDAVCAFLAVLESVKARRIRVYQNRMFGDIRIRRREAVKFEVGET